jgi:hypothetical protein
MDWLERSFAYALVLSWWQQLGLAFLLGSFAVATLSDLKRLSAQREFVEVWLLFVLAAFLLDAYDVHSERSAPVTFAIKWGLIAVLSLLSFWRVGLLFRLAIADVAALAATASLLTPTPIFIFYGIAKVIAWLTERLIVGDRPYYPFMPVVSLATLCVLVLALLP